MRAARRLRAGVAGLLLASACAGAPPGPGADAGSQAAPDASRVELPDASDAAVDGRPAADLDCDERADCAADTVCCAGVEEDPEGRALLVTRCLPSCVTGLPRVQVCRADAECESGSCRPYDCGPRLAGVRFCERPEPCL